MASCAKQTAPTCRYQLIDTDELTFSGLFGPLPDSQAVSDVATKTIKTNKLEIFIKRSFEIDKCGRLCKSTESGFCLSAGTLSVFCWGVDLI
ncbi:hypothetical protein JCM14076_05090 [Methylosoma difficile]